MIAKAFIKLKRFLLCKIDQKRYIEDLGINAADPSSVHIYGKVEFGSEPWIITLGNNVHLTNGVQFITHDGGTLLFRDRVPDLEITKPIIIGDDVYVGTSALLLPGITIGDGSIIAAGAVVTKNVPAGEVWGGVPARRIETSEEYLTKAKSESLHLGHLKGQEKDVELRKYYGRM